MQIQDFFSHYQAKSDEELLQLANDFEQLSPEARLALNGELSRRRIEIADGNEEEQARPAGEEPENPGESPPRQSTSSFLNHVVMTYQAHAAGFVTLALPAVLIGYLVTGAVRLEVREIVSYILANKFTTHPMQFVAIALLNLTAAFVSWVLSCISFGAISFATREVTEHRQFPSFLASFSKAYERIGALFRLAVVLFAIAMAGGTTLMSCWSGVIVFVAPHVPPRFNLAVTATPYLLLFFGMLAFSRVWAAVPALVLDHCTVRDSLFRSDERTEGKWSKLAILVAKSLVGGYVAGLLPFWIAAWATSGVPCPAWISWALDALSVFGVSAVEPLLFIGFSLIYVQDSSLTIPEAGTNHSRWAGAGST